ncbi:tripartite motif-containing protein 3-like [Glandiceps talaboti]
MATAAPDLQAFLDKFGEDFLSCAICFEQYREPKVLPCDHTFCTECLITLVKREGVLNCPTCTQRCQLPKTGVNGLKANFFMNSLLDLVETNQPAADVKEPGLCEGCDENAATHRCVDCSIYFCSSCTKSHKRVPMSRNHDVITLDEYKESKSTRQVRQLSPQKLFCKVHPENLVKFFCASCQVTVCSDCAFIKHRTTEHVHVDLQEAADEYTIQLKEMVGKLREKEKETKRCKSTAIQTRDQLQVQCQEEEKKVRKKAEEVIWKVRKEERRLVEELKTEYGQKVKTAEVQIDEWEMKHGNIASMCGYIETLIHHGSAAQLLSNKQKTVSHMQGLISMETKQQQKPECMEFMPARDTLGSDILGLLHLSSTRPGAYLVQKSHHPEQPGSVLFPQHTTGSQMSRHPFYAGEKVPTVPQICASKCTVEKHPTDILENESSDIVIQTKDSQGRQVIPTPVVKVEMRKPDGTREDVKVTDNRDGTLVYTMRGGMEGSHQVTMAIGDQLIPGSPFIIKVNKRGVKVLGKKGGGRGCFIKPSQVTLNKRKQFVVTEKGNSRVQVIDKDGNHVKDITFTQFEKAFKPKGVAVSEDGDYYMTDYNNHQVVVSDEDGKLIRCFGQDKLKYPRQIAVSPLDGTVYVTEWDSVLSSETDKTTHCIRKYTKYGKYITTVGSYGTGQAQFKGPTCLCVSKQGRVYVPDFNNSCVQVFNHNCKFLYMFGSKGNGREGDVRHPEAVVMDKDENLYITEKTNKRVQKFTSDGDFICRIDREEDGLIWPRGITVTDDMPPKVVVVDYDDHCLKIFQQ